LIAGVLSSQDWIEVRLHTGNTITLSGAESSPTFVALLSVAGIAVFLGLYLKNRGTLVALLAGLFATLGAVFAMSPLLFEGRLQVAEQAVARATGVQGWSAQLESVISNATTTQMITVTGLMLAISLFLQAAGITKRLSTKNSPAGRNKKLEPKHADVDLWNETSQ
jgi:hypothetical protein